MTRARARGVARLLQRGAPALKLGARAAADEVEQARAVARGKQQHALCACAVPPSAAHLLVVPLRDPTSCLSTPPDDCCEYRLLWRVCLSLNVCCSVYAL